MSSDARIRQRSRLATAVLAALFVLPPALALAAALDDATAARASAEIIDRHGLGVLASLDVPVADAFAPGVRKAMPAAEAALGKLPGVQRVVGPSGLVDLRAGVGGAAPAVAPMLSDPPDDAQGVVVPERLKWRNDALGWFFAADGRAVRFVAAAADPAALAQAAGPALEAAGLKPAGPVRAIPFVPSARGGLMSGSRVALVVAGALVGLLLGGLVGGRLRLGPKLGTAVTLGAAVATLVGFARLPDFALRAVHQGRTPFIFVEAKGDPDDPLTLRELRRLCDYARTLPAVENAWSVADVFPAFALSPDTGERIPDAPADVRKVWALAATDAALALEAPGDRRNLLVVVRLKDGELAAGREVLDKINLYLAAELRSSMLPIAVGDDTLPAETRTVGKGVLAGDAKERILRLTVRYGRHLSEDDALGVDRVTKQAAFVQTGERSLADEVVAEVVAFLAGPTAPKPADPKAKLGDRAAMLAVYREQPGDATVDDVKRPLAAYFPTVGDAELTSAAAELRARLAEVRRKHAARLNAKEMFLAADLPASGRLADEVRAATLDAMAPTVGMPVDPSTVGAILIDAHSAGGAVIDRALSAELGGVPGRVAPWAAGALLALLLLAGGARGLAVLPVALAPAALLLASLVGRGRPAEPRHLFHLAAALALGGCLALAWCVAARLRASKAAAAPAVATPS